MESFCKKGVLEDFEKFTRKHLCQSLFFNKVEGQPATSLIKKETLVLVLFCEFCEIFKNTSFIEQHRWLLQNNSAKFTEKHLQ